MRLRRHPGFPVTPLLGQSQLADATSNRCYVDVIMKDVKSLDGPCVLLRDRFAQDEESDSTAAEAE